MHKVSRSTTSPTRFDDSHPAVMTMTDEEERPRPVPRRCGPRSSTGADSKSPEACWICPRAAHRMRRYRQRVDTRAPRGCDCGTVGRPTAVRPISTPCGQRQAGDALASRYGAAVAERRCPDLLYAARAARSPRSRGMSRRSHPVGRTIPCPSRDDPAAICTLRMAPVPVLATREVEPHFPHESK